MAAQAEALAALETKHAAEWAAFEADAAAARGGASKKKLKQINFELTQRESDLQYRQHEELEAGEGDDAATVEEEAVVVEQKDDEAIQKAKKLARARKKKEKREAKARVDKDKARELDAEAEEVRRNSERKRECERIEEKLRGVQRRIKDVAADGHCLYRAVADQTGMTYGAARATCAAFMEAHESDFAPFVDVDFRTHCAAVRGSAEWGGQPEVLALAKALQRPIVVYSRYAAPLTMGDGDDAVVVTYHRDYYALGEHYNSTELANM